MLEAVTLPEKGHSVRNRYILNVEIYSEVIDVESIFAVEIVTAFKISNKIRFSLRSDRPLSLQFQIIYCNHQGRLSKFEIFLTLSKHAVPKGSISGTRNHIFNIHRLTEITHILFFAACLTIDIIKTSRPVLSNLITAGFPKRRGDNLIHPVILLRGS